LPFPVGSALLIYVDSTLPFSVGSKLLITNNLTIDEFWELYEIKNEIIKNVA